MREALLGLGMFVLAGLSFAQPPMSPMGPQRHAERQWCQQNWDRCRQFRLEVISIREKYIPKERECIQNAKDYWAMEECLAPIRVQKKRDMEEVKRKLRGS